MASSTKMIDATEESKEIVDAVRCNSRDNSFTLLHFLDVFRGSKKAKVKRAGHDEIKMHGRGKTWLRTDAERLFRRLVSDEYLMEELVSTRDFTFVSYIRVGPKANELLSGKVRIHFPITRKVQETTKQYKQRGRRRKSQQFSEPDPHAVIGMMNDHDYSRNPWLEPFGETVVIDMGSIGGEVEV